MNTFGFRLFLCLAALLVAAASLAEKKPRLVLEHTQYDLGTFEIDTVRHEVLVNLTNQGDTSLIIYEPSLSCTCMTATVPTDTIAPGDSAIIRVLLSVGKFSMPNEHLREMTVYSSDLHPQIVEFTYKTIFKTYEPDETEP